MNKTYFLLLVAFIVACNNKPKNSSTQAYEKSSKSSNPIDTLKKINDVKLLLLDARNDKAVLLLGKPDVKGQIMMGNFYYMVYFSKVNDGGKIKHLVLFVDGKTGINNASPIYKIVAVNDGETIDRAGNFAQWLQVSKAGIKSNSTDFSTGSGSKTWLNVEASGRGPIKTADNVIGDTKFVTSTSELPDPKEAVKNTQIKKYQVTNLSAREVYVWYAEKFQAVIKEGYDDGEHKYLGIPYYGNDTCILLQMTGAIDGSIKLVFSFECDGNP